jgi:hypothetical protein
MAQTAASDRINRSFLRCNFVPTTRPPDGAKPAAKSPARSFETAKSELLDLINHAIGRIEQGAEAKAALRELWAVLLEIKAIVARDPGMRMAADDLLAAATMLATGESTDPGLVDVRRWRLLKDAETRLRTRLSSAEPSDEARLSGPQSV